MGKNSYEKEKEKAREKAKEKAIFNSWRNCARSGLSPDLSSPVYSSSEEQIECLQKSYSAQITALVDAVQVISPVMPESATFLLTDDHGVLLKKNSRCFVSL